MSISGFSLSSWALTSGFTNCGRGEEEKGERVEGQVEVDTPHKGAE
jgi:hypothetical protein